MTGEDLWPGNKVRDTFIKFFESKQHVNWKSSSVVPHGDPTLLFANAGMNQYKPIFFGTADPNTSLSQLNRACNTQKCIRAGGKHNDLDDVGKDTYHHTFFEMLGNWSFNNSYSKKEAIDYAWELLTEVYHLPKDRIYATYFGGDGNNGVADHESREHWLQHLPDERVLAFGSKDNFWEMGDTGPCGPCTEIHFDRIGNRDAASLVNRDDPTVIEIWNLVFIQFCRETDGSLKPLPASHVDTGMGFERLTSILQGKMSNYDTDIFLPVFEAIQHATGARPYSGLVGDDDVENIDMAYRVIADHIRTVCFAIADGCYPGNDGRDFVLKRILRRAVRYGNEILKAEEGFFSGLVKVVVEVMGDIYPELRQNEVHISAVIKFEEESFCKTLGHGIAKFNKAVKGVKGKLFSGKVAFELWDTYGFPLDLTQLMAQECKLVVDVKEFHIFMAEQRERSRSAHKKSAAIGIALDADATSYLHKRRVDSTNDLFKFTCEDHNTMIKAIYCGNGFLDSISGDHEGGVILESTSFYAEQGGQIYDTGFLQGELGLFQVNDVQVFGGFVVHIGSFSDKSDRFCVGDKVTCKVDYIRRSQVAANHTCTHMLNFALTQVLGDHVDQKGSLVLPEKLRFDFSHGEAINLDELRRIESMVNKQIEAEMDVYSDKADLAEAKRVNGLRAVFGQVYPDPVRIVAIGQSVEDLLSDPESKKWMSISTELCGGTHISNTREAKAFTIMSEESSANGIRRITAVTRDFAQEAVKTANIIEEEVNAASQSGVEKLKSLVETAMIPKANKSQLQAKISAFEKQLFAAKKKIEGENIKNAIKVALEEAEVASSNGKVFCVALVNVGADKTAVCEAVVKVKEHKGMAVMVISKDDIAGKVLVCAGIPENKMNQYEELKFDLKEWLNAVLGPLKGKGGGKGCLVQGQGSGIAQVDEAIEIARNFFCST